MALTLFMIVVDLAFMTWGWKLFNKTGDHIWIFGIALWSLFLGMDVMRFFDMLGAM